MSFIVKIILLKMQVPKDANFLNSVLNFNFFCFDAWILISNEESDENNVWFSSRFSLGIKTHARDEFSLFLLAIKLMNY